MIEILFKAKRKDNREWVEGYHTINHNNGKAYITIHVCDVENNDIIDPSTVCQYTGKKDKNGVRAFECDKVYDPNENRIFVIKWDKEIASFVLLDENGWMNKEITRLSYCEVIGNIHDKEE